MGLSLTSYERFTYFLRKFPIEHTCRKKLYIDQYIAAGHVIAEYIYDTEGYYFIDEDALFTLLPPNPHFHGSLNVYWDSQRSHTVVERRRGANLQLHFYEDGDFKRVLYRNDKPDGRWKEGSIYHRAAQSLYADYKAWKLK